MASFRYVQRQDMGGAGLGSRMAGAVAGLPRTNLRPQGSDHRDSSGHAQPLAFVQSDTPGGVPVFLVTVSSS